MKLICSLTKRSLSREKPRFLAELENEMVALQIKRGAGGCVSFEELNSTVSVLSTFSWSLSSVIQSFMSDTHVWRVLLV